MDPNISIDGGYVTRDFCRCWPIVVWWMSGRISIHCSNPGASAADEMQCRWSTPQSISALHSSLPYQYISASSSVVIVIYHFALILFHRHFPSLKLWINQHRPINLKKKKKKKKKKNQEAHKNGRKWGHVLLAVYFDGILWDFMGPLSIFKAIENIIEKNPIKEGKNK